MLISKILYLSTNAHHHFSVRSIDCAGFQHGCQRYYPTADCVLTSGCSVISQHIWIKICIMLAILVRYIKSQKLSTGKRCMWIAIFDWQNDDLGTFLSGIIASWGGWGCGVVGRGSVRCGVGCRRRSGGRESVPLCLQPFCVFCTVPFWQGRNPAMWFWGNIARWLSIAAFTFSYPGYCTACFFSSRTFDRGFLITYCLFCIGVRNNPPVAIFMIFEARCMWDCFSCHRPPCLAIVSDMLQT
jgi:hypothetical protein